MRLVVICLLLSLTRTMAAPLSVQLRCDHDSYLVYEAIPIVVNLHNYTGRTIQIDETDQKSSLDFVVTNESGQMASINSALVTRRLLFSTKYLSASNTFGRSFTSWPLRSRQPRPRSSVKSLNEYM